MTFLARSAAPFASTVLSVALLLGSAACGDGGGTPDALDGSDLAAPDVAEDLALIDTALDPTVIDVPQAPDLTVTPDAVVIDRPGDVGTPPPDVPPCNNGDVDTMDLSQAGLIEFALSGDYRCWLAEPTVHDSAGPHARTGVRTFFNNRVTASLRAGSGTHPRGSILVKELYDGSDLMGYAIDVKVEDGAGPTTWLFYEGFAPSFTGYYGIANGTCTGCHSMGVDYVRSRLPE